MDFNIKDLSKYKEDNRHEVISATGGLPNSLWDTYSAFANCYGGVIILGVGEREDGSWYTSGLTDERKLINQFWNTIRDKKKVSLNILTDNDVKTYTEESSGNTIIVINVPPAKRSQKPIYINNDLFNGTYRRNFEGDYHCTKDEVLSMLRDQTENTSDMEIVKSSTIDQLNIETIRSYRNRHRLAKPGHPWTELDNNKYLQMIGAAKQDDNGNVYPTAAGLLMFGDEYRILYEFPEYFLDYREVLDPTIRWTDRLQSSSGEWSGNLFDFYFRVYNKLIKDIKVPFKLVGGDRVDDTPVHKALREALANCLVNTDFFTPRGIVILKEDDKIILENPGYIRVGKYQMKIGGESDPRNKALMKMFNMIDIGERAGSGVPQLYSVWEKEGWEEPIIEERFTDVARTKLILPLKKKRSTSNKIKKETKDNRKITQKTQEKLNIIKDYMKPGIDYTAEEIAQLFKLQRTRTNELLSILVNQGFLQMEGAKKSRKYRLL